MVPRTSAAADAVDLNLVESSSFKIIDQIKRSKMKGGDTTRVFASIGAKPMVYLASGMQLALMAVSYTTCVYSKHCPAWLPTISNTWEAPPGNYLSRWVVSFVCALLQVGLLMGYYKTATFPKMSNPRAVTLSASVGVFCLIPSCRGDNAIHTPLAVTFFILFNMYMVILTVKTPPPQASSPMATKSRIGRKVATGVSVACTSFFVANIGCTHCLGTPLAGSDTITAIIEWSDVLLVLAWFC
eukprot:gene19820-3871_t